MVSIYILELKNSKYYVGKTKNINFRIGEHFNSYGSAWTTKHKPIKVLKIIKNCDDYDEDKYTIKYMEKFGIDNVRGGTFCQMALDFENKNTIKKMLISSNNKCYKCLKTGHFASKCPTKTHVSNANNVAQIWQCGYCDKQFTTKKGTIFHENIYCKKKVLIPKLPDDVLSDSSSDESISDDDNYTYNKQSKCYKCGRKGHYSNNCYASKHIR
jgi:hypothetical protein